MTNLRPGQAERILKTLRIGNAASANAQAENRRLRKLIEFESFLGLS